MHKITPVLFFLMLTSALAQPQESSGYFWRFAVSGDSRNCGDVVMPAIAKIAQEEHVSFYWHLGDYRAIYDFDQDFRQMHPEAGIASYEAAAWPDFIEEQLKPFGNLPVYLGLGNHELISPKTRAEAMQQFADWFNAAPVQAQRLQDNPADHFLKAYYHWINNGVDFINLDNSSNDQFDDAQREWFEAVIDRAAKNAQIKTVVVGMHEALPDSLSTGHSMNESAQGTLSGRAVYKRLVDFRTQTRKKVYVLASHSHFYLEDVYNTACRREHPESILPGWIVGTAGAVRYRLPDGITASPKAQPDTYGYLVGEVAADGTISFRFKSVEQKDIPLQTVSRYTDAFVRSCFEGNRSTYAPQGAPQPPGCP